MLIVCSLSHVYWYGLSIALDLTTGRITAVLEQKPEVKLLNCGCLLSWEQLDMNTIFVGAKQENIMTCFFECQFLIETTGYMTTPCWLDHWNFNVRSLWSKPFSSFFKWWLHQNHKLSKVDDWNTWKNITNICRILTNWFRPQKEIPVLWWCAIPKRPQQQGKVWCVFRWALMSFFNDSY